MVVNSMKVCLINVKVDTSVLSDMQEYLRVRGSDYLYTLLFVNGRSWHCKYVSTLYEVNAGALSYEADIELEATPNEILLLRLEGTYQIEEYVDA
jgi:hypothetical protein